MKLLLIELHGMDVSCIDEMPFLQTVATPHEFQTYTGLAATAALWKGTSDIAEDSDYHDHFWDGSSGIWDANIFRLFRGDLHLSKNWKIRFRLTKTRGYFQDCEIFKTFDFSFSERPIIATDKVFRLDPTFDEAKRIVHFSKYWHKTLNYIRLNKIDRLGHKYGPDSIQAKEYAKCLDKELRDIYRRYKGKIIVFSLTGMIRPSHKINVMRNLQVIRNLVFFVDDENIRIWDTGNAAAVKAAVDYVNSLGCGTWLRNKPPRKFGDYFYRANSGVAFVPNHYVKTDLNGIHTLKGWMVSTCGTVDHVTKFKNLIQSICAEPPYK